MARTETRFRLTQPLTALIGPRISWLVVALGIVLSGLLMTFAPEPASGPDASSNLPDSAESARAAERLAGLPSSETLPSIVVYSRDGEKLSGEDLGAIGGAVRTLGDLADGDIVGPIPSENGEVALVTVPIRTGLSSDENKEIVQDIRDTSVESLPEGLTAEVTGPSAIQADVGAVFSGADVKLLLVTASVVALLLLITYRSPWLWLVPLSIIGIGDRSAAKVLETVSHFTGIPVDGSITGITSVLVFGAGTNYALLLIARYREELRRHEDRRDAMKVALRGASPAILASSGTVMLGLLALTLADTPFVSTIGLAGAIGIAVALFFALFILPSAMVLPGRWLFWPFVPRHGDHDTATSGAWFRLGRFVTKRPVLVMTGGLAALVVLAAGGLGLTTGLSQSDQFIDTPESIQAQDTLATSFPAGLSSPVRIATTPDRAAAVEEAAAGIDGVDSIVGVNMGEDVAEVAVSLANDPGDRANGNAIAALRSDLDAVDPDALVGGADAEMFDEMIAAADDRTKLVPIVLVIVLLTLLVLLRSIVAAVLLVATTVLSYFSALGIGWFLFDRFLGWPAMDVSTPLLAFIFLVALGVDYNIFLTARAREEMAESRDATDSIVTALAVTGGVITSAGVLLAAVFAVLGVLPLVLLAQLGTIVGIGVLLDTIIVRSIITPAMVALVGRWFWWPSALAKKA